MSARLSRGQPGDTGPGRDGGYADPYATAKLLSTGQDEGADDAPAYETPDGGAPVAPQYDDAGREMSAPAYDAQTWEATSYQASAYEATAYDTPGHDPAAYEYGYDPYQTGGWDPATGQPLPPDPAMYGDPQPPLPRRSPSRRGRGPAAPERRKIVTPARLVLLVALIGSIAFLAWGVLTRGPTQVPFLITGLGILGITLATIALGGAVVSWRSGVRGRGGRAFVAAVFGGLFAIAAFVCFTGAVIFTLLWRAA